MHYDPEALRARRAAHARAHRRRLTVRVGVLVAVGAIGAAAVLAKPWASAPHHGFRVSGQPVPPVIVRHPTATTRAWGLETAPQLAAVRRLAASGLPVFCGGRSKRMVALTFDDGPGVYTHLAVKKVRQFHIRATFFLVGKEIRAWPGWAQREKPYAVFGDHTMTHPFLPALPQAEMVEQIAGARALIERTVEEPVALFRPPYGARSPAIQREVTSLGMLDVLWNVDSADSLGASYLGIERNVIAGLQPGSIILMHENHGQTIRALATIFAALAHRHLEAVTVSQLIADDPPSLSQLRAGGRGCGVLHAAGNGG